MTILASLADAYDRLADRKEVPPFGYSNERIGFLIALREDGRPAGPPIDLREGQGKKRDAPLMPVPSSSKRPGVTPRAFFLWDNTAYALGVTASEGKDGAARFAAFRERHRKDLKDTDDPGLLALLRFVETWTPDQFDALGWPSEMKDQNVVFALESDRRRNLCIHDRSAARALWVRLAAAGDKTEGVCLVSGARGPIARLHPSVKGVLGAQTAGASIVSFNLDAFTSYGHEQGDNAPVSEAAAFAYTTALNRFLERDSKNRIQIGDASTVFWADASDGIAEAAFGTMFGEQKIDEGSEAAKVGAVLERIRAGQLTDFDLKLFQGVRFHVLGLSPNAARLSIRFWLDDDFGEVAQRYAAHMKAMRIEPPPRDAAPSIWRCLIETARQRETKNIPPNLAGEWLRAILTGGRYPLTLLATVLMRLRADKDVTALRVAMLKAVLIRNFEKEVPVSLNPDNKDLGYLLGRLFATYEAIQTAALGRSVNATIRDKFYGAASATPRRVFTLLDRGSANHLSKVGKDNKGKAINLEKQVAAIMAHFDPSADPFPTSLPADQQALFAVGYYHQKDEFFRRKDPDAKSAAAEEPQS